MIALAIESSKTRGMGHLFRSLLYVDYLKQYSLDFVYLINDDKESIIVLQDRNIPFVIVDYYDTESKWECKIIDTYKVNIWINDKFETSEEMAQHVRSRGVFLALIDDIGPGEVYADVHFVGLISFTKKCFKAKNTLIGMEYVVLNKEIEKYRRLRSKVDKIIVSFGGSDPYSNTLEMVRHLLNSQYKFDVTIGPNSSCKEELIRINNGRYNVYQGVDSLVELFSHYDLVITGGGVTCCEANAAGLPCIIIANAPHEINTGKYMEEFGGCVYAGSYLGWDTGIIENICKLDIENMSKKGMEIFKTDAVGRIFDYIFMNSKNSFRI